MQREVLDVLCGALDATPGQRREDVGEHQNTVWRRMVRRGMRAFVYRCLGDHGVQAATPSRSQRLGCEAGFDVYLDAPDSDSSPTRTTEVR